MLVSDLRDNPAHAVNDYQTAIDELCRLIRNPDLPEQALVTFFNAHPDLDNVDGRDSQYKFKPVQHAALKGNFTALRFLIEVKKASVVTDVIRNAAGKFEAEMNLIEFTSQEKINPDIQTYIQQKKLWLSFRDKSLLEVHVVAWCGDVERTMEFLLEGMNLTVAETEKLTYYITDLRDLTAADIPIIQHIAHLTAMHKHPFKLHAAPDLQGFINDSFSDEDDMRISEEDDDDFSDDDLEGDETSRQQKRVDKLCRIAGDRGCDHLDLASYIQEIRDTKFDVNARHTESKQRAVEYAAESGSFTAFRYLIEVENANLAYDPEAPVTNLLCLISPTEKDKVDYYIANRLWERQKDGTTALHVYSWAGKLDEIKKMLPGNEHLIFDTSIEGESALDWAYVTQHETVLNFLLALLDEMRQEALGIQAWDDAFQVYETRAKYYSNVLIPEKSIENYQGALYCYSHCLYDTSTETRDRLQVALAEEYHDYSVELLKNVFSGSLDIITTDQFDATIIIRQTFYRYSLDAMAALFHKANTAMIEALHVLQSTSFKTDKEIAPFIIYRRRLLQQFITLAEIYDRVGGHYDVKKQYWKARAATILAQQALQDAFDILALQLVFSEQKNGKEPKEDVVDVTPLLDTKRKKYFIHLRPDMPPADPAQAQHLLAFVNTQQRKIDIYTTQARKMPKKLEQSYFFKTPVPAPPIQQVSTSSSKSRDLVIRR